MKHAIPVDWLVGDDSCIRRAWIAVEAKAIDSEPVGWPGGGDGTMQGMDALAEEPLVG